MNNPALIRKEVRAALALVPKRPFTEPMIFNAVRDMLPDALSAQELNSALQWNKAQGYIADRHDTDLDATVWQLTEEGKTKEGVK